MKKTIALITILFFAYSILFSNSFAANGLEKAGDAVKNVVGGTENTIENVASGIGNTVKDGMDKAGEATHNTINSATNAGNQVKQAGENTMAGTTRNNNDGSYTATRTSTTQNGKFMGMTGSMWTWLIVGLAGIGIISMVWYYAKQDSVNSSRHS